MRALPAFSVAVIALGLSGCSTPLKTEDIWARSSAFIDRSTGLLTAQGQRLSEYAGSLLGRQDQQLRDEEVTALFAQKRIDPLTRYIEEHSGDASRAPQLARVARERELRCGEIAELYSQREPNRENLARLRRNYLYSCPLEVAEFANRASRAASLAAEVADERAAPAPTSDPVVEPPDEPLQTAVSRQLNRNCYLLFTIRNYRQAVDACREPAELGDAKAQHHMASMARVRGDHAAARDWAERSAQQKHAPAQLLLGQIYQEGRGVGRDEARARQLMRQAADAGMPEAAFRVAQAFQEGMGGPVDLAQAEIYFKRAAQQDHLPSHLALATLYDITRRPTQARQWLEQAARKGSADAQFALGQQHAAAEDAQEAYVWYSLALLNGETRAKPEIVRQESRLNKEQLAAAQTRIQAGINGQWR